MTLRLKCKCGAELNAPTSLIGKTAKCTGCGFCFTVPGGGETEAVKQAIENPPADSQCESCGFAMASSEMVCLQCGYHHRLKRKVSDPDPTDPPASLTLGLILMAAAAVIGTGYLQAGMNGPSFLLFYWSLFLLLGVSIALLRKAWFDSDLFNYVAMGTLLAIGALRIYFAISNKNYRFSFLLLGMVGVAIVFMAARSHSENSRCKAFESKQGGLNLPLAGILFAFVLTSLGIIFFVPSIGKIVAQGSFMVPLITGFIGLSMLSEPGSGRGGGHYHSCGSSCGGGGCGGGGCGGGCGGCGG